MDVEVDLDLQREQSLHANVKQTQVAIHEVVVQVQPLALGRLSLGLSGLKAERERATRLKHREKADEPLFDAVALGEFARRVLPAQVGAQILKRPPILLGHGLCMRLDPFGVGQQKRLEIATANLVGLKELRHCPARHDGQVAAKQHAFEARQHTVDAILVLVDELELNRGSTTLQARPRGLRNGHVAGRN